MKLKKLLLSGLAALTAAASATTGVFAEAFSSSESAAPRLAGVNAASRTQQQIRTYLSEHPFDLTTEDTYSKSPDLSSPYTSSGQMSAASRTNALNALNCMRYIAGLSEVTLNSDYNQKCQDGAYISYLNKSISGYPEKPSGVSDSIYKNGSEGCVKSSYSKGYFSTANAVARAFVPSSDDGVISSMLHRRRCLNPAMSQTGFGAVETYALMYSRDNEIPSSSTSVCWPAQNMPIEYFYDSYAWSYSPGSAVSNPTGVKVTLKRKSDGKTWNFSSASSDGFFSVDNSNFGTQGCIVFRPDNVEYEAGDVFSVSITGLGAAVSYNVNFFHIDSTDDELGSVTGLKATPSSTSVKLTWNSAKGAEKYTVYKANMTSGITETVASTTKTSYTVEKLTPNTKYMFMVYAYKGTKYTYQNVQCTTKEAEAAPKPAAVKNLKAATTLNSIKLTWSKNANADGYRVRIYKGGKWVTLANPKGTSYTVKNLKEGTSYKFAVYSLKGGIYSKAANITAKTKTRPAAVKNLKAVTSASAVKLTWSKNANADGYRVRIYKGGKWVTLANPKGTSYTVKNLKEGTSYKFAVYSLKGGIYSKAANITAKTKTRPAAVKNLKAVTSASAVKLTWSKNANADGYRVRIYKGGKWVTLADIKGTSYTVKKLKAKTSYKLAVYSVKGGIYSNASIVTAKTK